LIGIVQISNKAITTSGNYERYFSVKGNQFSHIINPVTGYPQQGVISATVIAPTGIEADALATAMTVMGVRRGNGLIDRLGRDYASVMVTEENEGTAHYPSQNFNNILLDQK